MTLQGVEKRSERRSGKEGTGEKAEFTYRLSLRDPAFFASFQRSIIASQ
jgi:hypothetical protein